MREVCFLLRERVQIGSESEPLWGASIWRRRRSPVADGSGHFAPETADDVGESSRSDVVMGASGGILVQVERV
jgi:hypothetical protein